ncbi:MAG: lamin tail domain-containing protein [bacterium]|nr:lamin tail domain-containing protein [bacterium]
MENRKFVKFLISIFVLGFFVVGFNNVFAYGIETHAFLTDEIIKFYNQNFSDNKIPDELKNYLIDGSRKEDNIPRWMNHFYDPIYNRGLTDSTLGTWQKSKDWAQDSNNQNSLTYKVPTTIASILTAIQQRAISALTTETDFTWQKAIKFYVQGEKEKAMFILGHILHLMEDSSVPDHTRNDPHPGDSPYENWTEKFNINNPDRNLSQRLQNKNQIVFGDLNSYFNELAKYSNNNFYSKDRIGVQSGYQSPQPDYFKLGKDNYSYGFKIDNEFGDYYLLQAKGVFAWASDGTELINFPVIMEDYWSRLSTKSVQYGAGVVNLFFQEVEKAKNDPNFAIIEEKSFLAKALEATKNLLAQVGSTVSGIFKSDDSFQPAGEVSLNQSQDSSISGDQTSNITAQSTKQCSFVTSQSPSRQKLVINEVAWMGSVNSANDEWIELKNISNAAINLNGYQLIDQAEQIKIIFGSNDKIPANGFYLLEKTSDSAVPNIKADKIYTGQLSNTNEGLRLFDNNCNLIDEVFANPNWPAGDNSAKKTMERANDFSWHTSSIVGGTPKKENSQQIVVKKQELLINLLEETEEDNEEIAPQQQKQIQQATSSLQQTQQTANFKQCSFQTNQSPSRQKIIINEVAWMGTAASANDEWIELKNISGGEVDINGWQLIDKAEQIKAVFGQADNRKIINKKVFAGGFYLLERTDDNTLPTVTADFVYTGILSNSDEGLRLFDQNCNLVDEVLTNSGSDGKQWPAGNNTAKKTMERKSDFSWYTSSIVGGTPKRENSAPTISGGGGGTPSNNQQQTTNNQQQIKILINEIQISPTGNRFIELYNPNESSINLTGWYLQRKTQTGTSFGSLVSKTYFDGKTINDRSYFLISRGALEGADIILDNLTLAESNVIQLKNSNGEVVDKVGWGQASDCEGSCAAEPSSGQSIQRKFDPSTSSGFIDTDNNVQDFEIQTCPSPKAKTCQQANQAPSAFFVYSPSNPQVGDLITFNAASSTGQIISYQWNFGDNATSSVSTATTTHSYSQAGNYQVSLIVFDNQSVSSTATSTTISVNPPLLSGANHLVISEIYSDETGKNQDFIEIYNPTTSDINIKNWSLMILKNNATSTNLLAKFGSKTEDITLIKSKRFLLIGFDNYSDDVQADAIRKSASLPNSTSTVYLLDNNSTEIDAATYNKKIPKGQSLERKAFSCGVCVSSQLDGEFLGNGCDTDSASDWEIRDTPNPQNSLSFPEPRRAPNPPENFTTQYNSSAMELIFNWDASRDYNNATSTLTYKIIDISNASSTLSEIETASTTAKISINEISRDYNFSVQAFDKDMLGSATSTALTTVPSFLSGLYFYQDPRASNTDYLMEAYYSQYPFVPDLFGQGSKWKVLVFYLNADAEKGGMFYEGTSPVLEPANLNNVLPIKFKRCSGGSITPGNSLILPDTADRCGSGGVINSAFDFGELEDNHFLIRLASSTNEISFTSSDYFTVAYYSAYDWSIGRGHGFNLVAVDKTKYYFNQLPPHQKPIPPANLQFSLNQTKSTLTVSWEKFADPDTLDNLLKYEVSYNNENWRTASNWLFDEAVVEPNKDYNVRVRAFDDFGLESDILMGSFTTPEIPSLFSISKIKWGHLTNSLETQLKIDYSNDSLPDMIIFYLNQLPPLNYGLYYSGLDTIVLSPNAPSPYYGYRLIGHYYNYPDLASYYPHRLFRLAGDKNDISLPITALVGTNLNKTLNDLTIDDFITLGFYNIDPWGNIIPIGNDAYKYYFQTLEP